MQRSLYIDPQKCTGCLQCEMACSYENEQAFNPSKSRIKVFAFHEEGRFVVEDARRKFLTAHLGRFARAIAEREDVRADPVYGPVFAWCWQLVARECSDLGVDPAPLDFFADKDEKEEMKCGAVHLPVIS